MCGICGFISKQNITLAQLKEMNDTMYHRGPDDSGEEIFDIKDGYQIGMAQRRLSIMDLSPLGHQPMHSKDGGISVVFNGEIYNFLELRKELKEYPFCSNCDTEVIIAAYLKWGIKCMDRLNGMFAICLYDRETQDVYLVRDRIGKKPLYYEVNDGNLIFASELKPIMKREGFHKKIRKDILSRFLFQQYINAPDSIFENVYKLEPGSILKFHQGEITIWKYWDIKKVYHEMSKKPVNDYEQAKAELKELLNKAVASRMIADVPLGAFLSGGYDSSLMTAIAQAHSKKPVKTFSIGFHEERYNEAKYAKEVAEHLGTNHTELYIDEEEMLGLVESIPLYYDEPFADSSQIPTMLVSALARRDVTVALSGDGGDEFFCGYNIYENVHQAQLLDGLGGLVHGVCQLPGFRQIGLEEKLSFRVRVIAGNRNRETKTQFGASNYITRANQMVMGEGLPCHFPIESTYQVPDWQMRRMLLDMDTYLPGDILCKVDRASMKYSLEARCPILDKDVMEYSFRMAHKLKYEKGNKKRILKDIAYDYIPRSLLDRPKVGFGVPLDKWLRGPLKEQLTDMCSRDSLKRQGIFDADFTADMIENYMKTGDGGPATGANYSKLSWSFFTFQKWYQTYMR
ncbi:asparagine synthase (glutamine-hydrolyzing) [Parablautia muri]|uniref:asparagine synthase (glutamine-hydrolyzing) n=1 Tax=Parablautia muri TaxID=2320879 RepID=A0A9X5BCR9_9FIRM|nr:asparagine synthase (glutamine-hydrolyzing) [Parablautia muri]NBJ91289.1 asparagine synthase (glutamine-hydrolyzing) [Parablautia muri]